MKRISGYNLKIKINKQRLIFVFISIFIFANPAYGQKNCFVTIPFMTDHNRMLIDAELRQKDGTWRTVRLWVDSGSPVFTINATLANNLGIDLSESDKKDLVIPIEPELKIGGFPINTDNIQTVVKFQPQWIFSATHCDGNLPSTILKKYDIVFDYPKGKLTIAEPGSMKLEGIRSDAIIHPETGIVQIGAKLDGDSLSFALDCGASYSFISNEILSPYVDKHPEWDAITGTAGCANMWGWWPANEQLFPVVRIDKMLWGAIELNSFGIVGVPKFGPEGPTLGEWYSNKTLDHVCGFLGANVLKPYRVSIDYKNQAVYFKRDPHFSEHDMDIVGISVRQLPDSTYQVIGVANRKGKSMTNGIMAGDIIISIDNFKVTGETMGKVVDTLRGIPGDVKTITISRNGLIKTVNASVVKLL